MISPITYQITIALLVAWIFVLLTNPPKPPGA